MFGLEVWQLVFLGFAAAIGFTMWFDSRPTKVVPPVTPPTPAPTPVPVPTVVNPVVPHTPSTGVQVSIPHCDPNKDIVRIVCAWSSFKRECVKAGLTDAIDKLDDIFPLLVNIEPPVVVVPVKEEVSFNDVL